MTATQHRCPSCRLESLEPATFHREFHPRGQTIRVELLTRRCTNCGAQATSASQHDQNVLRLQACKTQYGELLQGAEIQQLRRRYGLSQQHAGRLFGKGKITFSRYETESSYPDASTTKLLRLAINSPQVMKALADAEGIALPLWETQEQELGEGAC